MRAYFHIMNCTLFRLYCQFRSGGIDLKICTVDMPSYTYAVKGERLLRTRGYPAEIRRNSGENGCGFSLVIRGDCRGALKLLAAYSVPYSLPGGGG